MKTLFLKYSLLYKVLVEIKTNFFVENWYIYLYFYIKENNFVRATLLKFRSKT